MNSRIFLLLLFLGALCNSKLFQTVALISHGARYHTNDLYDGGETKSLWG